MSTEPDYKILLIEQDPFDVILETGVRGGVGGAGTAGEIAVFTGTDALGGEAGLAWDAANKEFDVTGPGLNTATVYAQASAANGVAGKFAALATGGQALAAATGTGIGLGATASGAAGSAAVLSATHVTAVPLTLAQPTAASVPALVANINNVATVALSPAGAGGAYFNSAALATTATVGFLGIPSCAGTPTGVPTGYPAGVLPLVFDSTNGKLYVYYAAGWHWVALT